MKEIKKVKEPKVQFDSKRNLVITNVETTNGTKQLEIGIGRYYYGTKNKEVVVKVIDLLKHVVLYLQKDSDHEEVVIRKMPYILFNIYFDFVKQESLMFSSFELDVKDILPDLPFKVEKRFPGLNEIDYNVTRHSPKIFLRKKSTEKIQEEYAEYMSIRDWDTALVENSVSRIDARFRKEVYENMFHCFTMIKKEIEASSKYEEIPFLSYQYIVATLESYVRSFAGFLSIERCLDRPDSKLSYHNIIDTSADNTLNLTEKYIVLSSKPELLVTESGLMTVLVGSKENPYTIFEDLLTNLYTKLVNEKLVNAIISSWSGEPYTIDTAGFITKFLDFNSRLDAFQAELINIDSLMEKRSIRGIRATAYLVGINIISWFRKLARTGDFVDNTDNITNGLVGYYKGIPVLYHHDIGNNDGYAIHKSSNGQVAPLMRGISLPLTDIPMRMDEDEKSPLINGIFFRESIETIYPELIQKFTVTA